MRGRIKREAVSRSPQIPIIGHVKCGKTIPAKDRNGNAYDRPVSLDHFIATGKYATHFHQAFGDEPKSIPVTFTSNELESVCDERYEIRKGKARYGYGDGETFHVWSSEKEDYVRMTTADTPDLMDKVARRLGSSWDIILELRFLIPDIRGVVGLWRLTTKGKASSIPQITGSFDFMMDQAGTVIGIPFDLQVEKVTSQKPESKSSFPVISLVPNISTENVERIGKWIEAGMDLHRAGLLTDGKIEEMEPKQLEAQYETVVGYGDPSKLTEEEKAEYGEEE